MAGGQTSLARCSKKSSSLPCCTSVLQMCTYNIQYQSIPFSFTLRIFYDFKRFMIFEVYFMWVMKWYEQKEAILVWEQNQVCLRLTNKKHISNIIKLLSTFELHRTLICCMHVVFSRIFLSCTSPATYFMFECIVFNLFANELNLLLLNSLRLFTSSV